MTTCRMATESASKAPCVSRTPGGQRLARLALILGTALTPVWAMADTLPTGSSVVHGSVAISTTTSSTMTITQSSDRAVVNWDNFSIGAGNRVDIHQPNRDSAILNRVTGDTTSQIHGQLNANGRVFVVNPNGIFIGPTGSVNSGSFVASTLSIRTDDFVTGNTVFEGNGASATVSNAGTIQVVTGGYAALIGGKVRNSGTIQAPLGFVGLGSGERITLDLAGDGFLQVAVPTNSNDDGLEALIENSGTIQANGGTVQISAATARNAARHAINMSGVVEARTVSGRNGRITLGGGGGGKITVRGTIRTSSRRPAIQVTQSARPTARPERGGDITITGRDIVLAGAQIDASGTHGGGLIRIGGEYRGTDSLPTAETLTVDRDTFIQADALTQGDGGRVILWSDLATEFAGKISARGGAEGGHGGFAEVSGKIDLTYRGNADLRADAGNTGELLLDPTDIEIVTTATEVNQIEAATLISQLDSASVSIETSPAVAVGPDPVISFADAGELGTITIDAALNWTSNSTLSLVADRTITINQSITATNGGLTLTALNSVGDPISTGPEGHIDVGTFRLQEGYWEQIGDPLPSFRATNFVLDTGSVPASFLRVLGGSSTANDPYLLADVYGLQGMTTIENGNLDFALANDIDASVTAGWFDPFNESNGFSNSGFVPNFFGASLDGRRHTISNLFIRQYAGVGGFLTGLFSQLGSGAEVRELSVTAANISGPRAGIIAGTNSGVIEGVSVQGTITTTGTRGGGIAGTNAGTIRSSFSEVTITDQVDPSFSSPPSRTELRIGGIAGENNSSSQLDQVHSAGSISFSVTENVDAGGIAGYNAGTVSNAYSSASVSGTSLTVSSNDRVGGITGYNYSNIRNVIANGPVSYSGASTNARTGAITGDDLDDPFSIRGSFFVPSTTGQTSSGAFGGIDIDFTTVGGGDESVGGGGVTVGGPAITASNDVAAITSEQLRNTQFFYDIASTTEFSWDFSATWSFPLNGLDQPRLYTTWPVITAIDAIFPDMNFIYNGSTTGHSAGDGLISGGPDIYLFGTSGDTGNVAALADQVILSDRNVGTVTYSFPSSFTSTQGQTYTVRQLPENGTVSEADLFILIDDFTKPFGTELTFSGVRFDASILFAPDRITGGVVISSGAAASVPISSTAYSVTLESLEGEGLSNYSIEIIDGTVQVVPIPATITINDFSKLYGETISFSGTEFTVSGISATSVTSLTISSAGASAEAQVSGGPFPVIGSGLVGTGLENYSVSIIPGSLTIIPAPLTITADDQNKRFGREFTFTGNEFTVTGLLNDDAVTRAALSSEATNIDAPMTGPAGKAILISDPQGTGLDNYSITLVNGIMVVGPGRLVITPNDQTKVYGTTFTFEGTEFTVTGIDDDARLDSVTLTSAAIAATAQVGASPFTITASNPVGTGLEDYELVFADGSFTIVPAPLLIRANDQTKVQGQPFSFGGTEFTTAGLLNADSVDLAVLTSAGAGDGALAADGPFAISVGGLAGRGLSNYNVATINGTFTVNDPIIPPKVNTIPTGIGTLPNPTDRFSPGTSISLIPSGPPSLTPESTRSLTRPDTPGQPQTLPGAQGTFAVVDTVSTQLETTLESCGSGDQDFANYITCLTASLDTYANALDQISNDLPPGLETVTATIRTARSQVSAAAARAQRRLASATSDAERRAIRRDALNEARGAVNEAKSEIRKAISLIRADDPEVAALQRQTGARVIQAFDTVDTALVRAIEL